MKIGVFGGSFDPVHNGHLAVARQGILQLALDKLFFIPAWISPHKTGAVVTSASHRRNMLELAIRAVPQCVVSGVELERQGVSYTVDTLRLFKEKYPSDELFFLMGADSFQTFSTWREPEIIRGLAHIAVAPRSLEAPPVSGIIYLEMPEAPVSSTLVRSALFKNIKLASGLVPDEVLRYIEENHLYTS